MNLMDYYRGMLIQRTRIEAFQQAIAATVRPGDRVLEIGAGLGTFSLFAARAGASRVYAIEGDAVIAVSKALARANGLADRIEFLRGWYPGLRIPAPIDVLIFEDFSARLLDSWTWRVLRQLHAEVLHDEVRMVARRARIWLAPVRSTEVWKIVGPYGGDGDRAYGLDWSASRDYIVNTPLQMPLVAGDLRHTPRLLTELELTPLPAGDAAGGDATWRFDTEESIHGLAYWFDLDVGGQWLSNAPGGDPRSWGNLYLPVAEPITVPAGGTLSARVRPEVAEDGAPSWLTWEVACAETSWRGHEFRSFPASRHDLVGTSPSWVPELTTTAQRELVVLRLTDGRRNVADIADALARAEGLDPAAATALARRILQDRTLAPDRIDTPSSSEGATHG